MKKIFIFCLLVIVFLMGCSGKQADFKLEKDTPAYTLALNAAETVPYLDPEKNNVLISCTKFNVTTGEVINDIQRNFGNRAGQLAKMSAEQIKANINQFSNIMGERKLLLDEARKAKIVTDPSRIDSILNVQYQRAGGEEKFIQFLERNGQTIDVIKEDILKRLTIESYINKAVYDSVQVTSDDIQKAYEGDKTATVRHILMSTQGKSDSVKQEIKGKMEEILGRAKQGEDFGELAKQYSEDPGSKMRGGLIENIQHGAMVKPFEDAAFSVPIGGLSDVFETQYGYHILTVIERKKETQPLEDVRLQLEGRLKQQKRTEAYQSHLENLKSKYEYAVVEF
jgi:parvulin-like peptidyl-prolyl isomerase